MRSWTRMTVSLFLFTMGTGGCGAEDTMDTVEDEEEATETTAQAVVSSNAVVANAVVANAVVANAVVANAVVANALKASSLKNQTALIKALKDTTSTGDEDYPTQGDYAKKVLQYIYECAMPPTSTLNLDLGGSTFTATGALNLAPEWGTSSCGAECTEWVSACVLARVNGYGVPITLSLRGGHPALQGVSDWEQSYYNKFEGRFWGQLFNGASNTYYACTGPNASIAEITGRVCSSVGGDCGITVVGACSEHCDANGWCRPDKSSGTYQRAIGTWIAPPPAATCGNGICQDGESSSGCPSDCAAETNALRHDVAGAQASILAAHSDGVHLVYAGITTAAAGDQNKLGGLPPNVTDKPESTRDMFIVKADSSGNVLAVRRISVPDSESPVAVGIHGSQIYVATGLTLRALDAATLQSKWWWLYTSETQQRFRFSAMTADANGVHVAGNREKRSGGSWVTTHAGYRRYSAASGAVVAAQDNVHDTRTTAVGLTDCSWYTVHKNLGYAVGGLYPKGVPGCPAAGSGFNLTVPGVPNPEPQIVTGAQYVAGRTASSPKVFIGARASEYDWSWVNTLTATDKGASIAIKTMAVIPGIAGCSGSLLISGTYSGRVDFGGSLPASPRAARRTRTIATDAFIAAYDSANGALRWVRTEGGPGNDAMNAVALIPKQYLSDGTVWGFGSITGTALVEGKYVTATGGALDTDSLRVGVGPLKILSDFSDD